LGARAWWVAFPGWGLGGWVRFEGLRAPLTPALSPGRARGEGAD
jgi:hypothetical protein